MANHAAAFWSYAHEDDEQSHGAILALADRLANEYGLTTGQNIQFFVDRKSIEWGDLWRQRIEGALIETTFLIPVVTPRYFQRQECRKELLSFIGRARSLGLEKLLLPILYVPVDDLSEDSTDDAVSAIAATQYEDWTDLRVEDLDSADCKKALRAMARKMKLFSDEAAVVTLDREARLADAPEAGLAELVQELRTRAPDLAEAIDDRDVAFKLHDATFLTFNERLSKLKGSGPRSAEFAITQKFATQLLPLAEQERDVTQGALAKAQEMDSVVLAAMSEVQEHPEDVSVLDVLKAVFVAFDAHAAHGHEIVDRSGTPVLARDWWRHRNHHTKVARTLQAVIAQSDDAAEQLAALVNRWYEGMTAVGAFESDDFPEFRRLIEEIAPYSDE